MTRKVVVGLWIDYTERERVGTFSEKSSERGPYALFEGVRYQPLGTFLEHNLTNPTTPAYKACKKKAKTATATSPPRARQRITEAAIDFALENGLNMNVLTSRSFQFLLDTRAEAGKIDYSVVLALRDHAETIKSGTFANRPDMICFLLERWATVRGIP